MRVGTFGIATLVAMAFAGLVTLAASLGSFFTVDQGERAVVLRNGALLRVAEPGLDFKFPFVDSVKTISVRDHTFKFDKVGVYSYDQQPATFGLSITYRVPVSDVSELYTQYGSIEAIQARAVERKVLDAAKAVFGQYRAETAIQHRAKLGVDISQAIMKSMEGLPINVVGVQIEDIDFSDAYEKSIEQRMLAQVEIETTRQQKQTNEIQAEIRVIKAKAEADSQLEVWKAEAEGIKLRGDAEAAAILAKAKALDANTNLVQLMAVDKWDGKTPVTMVPGSAVPFIGVK
jgi:regulator of protease activity HflC (stomatin/prohibitin superfamily)